ATVTPTWSQASGTPPALGNGSISARIAFSDQRITVDLLLTMGSTTTYGDNTADWTFSLPAPYDFNALVSTVGRAYALDASTAHLAGMCRVAAGAAVITCMGGLLPAPVSSPSVVGWRRDFPFVWGSGDSLQLHIEYEKGS